MTVISIRKSLIVLFSALGLGSCSGGDDGLGGGSSGPLVCPSTPSGGDPLFAYQWHLSNTAQGGGTPGEDVRALAAWTTHGFLGNDVRVAIVDDGLEIRHEDLCPNVVDGASYNYYRQNRTDPTGGDHGTAVAGLVAARDNNGVGLRGVAPRARLVGYNLIFSGSYSASDEADAMTRDAAANAISSNSWGAPDGYGTLDAPSLTWESAINTGVQTGRGGRGLVYLWAGGNGATVDNSNYDGQANFRGVMAVAAVMDTGLQASYSERGANLWISAPAGRCGLNALSTTDRTGNLGINPMQTSGDYSDRNYTNCMDGTSAATPVVSGAIALMVQANPNLGWRDIRKILAATARRNNTGNVDWVTTAGTPTYNFNHNYGFGVVDANAAVAAARAYTSYLAAEETVTVNSTASAQTIPDNNSTGVTSTVTVSASGITSIEYIDVTFNGSHANFGDLDITLTAPNGTSVSRLAETHTCQAACTISTWRFGSARHFGESADGVWTLRVADNTSGTAAGTFTSWSIKFYGT